MAERTVTLEQVIDYYVNQMRAVNFFKAHHATIKAFSLEAALDAEEHCLANGITYREQGRILLSTKYRWNRYATDRMPT